MRKVRMGKIVLTVLLTVSVNAVSGQTWKEWFKQKQTQKEYLIEQILALHWHLDHIRKGYDIVKDGTGLISDITDGEFSLHKNYFGSLKVVSPRIKQYQRIADIIEMQAYMLESYPNILKQSAGQLTPEEAARAAAIYSHLMKAVATDLEELLLVITDGRMEMSDDERLKRIDSIYARTVEKKAFFQRLSANILALAAHRAARARENDLLRELHGLKK